MSGVQSWLLSDSPDSAWQARCQRFYLGWLQFRANPIAMLGLIITLTLVLVAVFAPWIAGSSGLEPVLSNRLQPGSREHWFGTDELGRDIFDRIVWGSRITLYIVATSRHHRGTGRPVRSVRWPATWAAGWTTC